MGVFETTQPFNMILHMNCKNGIITTCIIAFISTDRFNVSHKSPLFIMSNPPPPFFFFYIYTWSMSFLYEISWPPWQLKPPSPLFS